MVLIGLLQLDPWLTSCLNEFCSITMGAKICEASSKHGSKDSAMRRHTGSTCIFLEFENTTSKTSVQLPTFRN